MKPIKIYGESKTGTTYLEHLLLKNTDAEVLESSDWGPLGWKHGFPQVGDAFYIFIFRNIYGWAESLKNSTVDKRFHGLTKPFGLDPHSCKTWDNPIQCRATKYYAYLGFSSLHESLLISLESLTEAKTLFGLSTLGYDVKFPLQPIDKHVYADKRPNKPKEKKPLTDEEKKFIEKQKDPELEQFVTNLTFQWTP